MEVILTNDEHRPCAKNTGGQLRPPGTKALTRERQRSLTAPPQHRQAAQHQQRHRDSAAGTAPTAPCPLRSSTRGDPGGSTAQAAQRVQTLLNHNLVRNVGRPPSRANLPAYERNITSAGNQCSRADLARQCHRMNHLTTESARPRQATIVPKWKRPGEGQEAGTSEGTARPPGVPVVSARAPELTPMLPCTPIASSSITCCIAGLSVVEHANYSELALGLQSSRTGG